MAGASLILAQAVPYAADPTPVTGRALVVALVVVGLLAALAWALRRNAVFARARQALAVETAMSLGERRSLVVVTVEGRRLLLGLTPTSVSLVTELDRTRPEAFAEALDREASKGTRRDP